MRKFACCLLLSIALFVCQAQSLRDTLKVENLVFEGAGIRGIAYCGALMELDERGILEHVKRVAGTSSGAITASLLSVGYTPQEIFDVIGNTDFAKFNDGRMGLAGGAFRLRKHMGWYKGNEFLHWLEGLIAVKTTSSDITFRQLYQLAKASPQYKELTVAATCLNHQTSLYFSAETFPDMRIVDAVRASMAIPLYYEPLIVDRQGRVISQDDMLPEHFLCVDGGFTANFIVSYYDTKNADGSVNYAPTLGLRLDSDAQILNDTAARDLAFHDITDTRDFIGAFYYIIKETMNRQLLTQADWERTVSISDCAVPPKVKRLSNHEKDVLINSGRKGTRTYFK